MLTDVKATNFKRHRTLDIEFTDGLNLITGGNYQGKSSLLHAIMFALGGVRAVPGGSSVITTRGEKTTSVSLGFPVNGNAYRVTRSGSSATLEKDGEVIAKSSTAVNERIELLLGMSIRRFKQLRYGEQKATEALLTLGAGELHSIIKEVSQADLVEKVIALCAEESFLARGGLEAMPVVDVAALADRVQGVSRDLKARYAELSGLRQKTSDADIKSRDAEQVYAKALRRQDEARAAANRLTELRLKLDRARREQAELASGLADPAEIARMERSRSSLEKAMAGAAEEASELRHKGQRVATLSTQVSTLHSRLQDSMSHQSRVKAKLDECPPIIDTGSMSLMLRTASEQYAVARSELDRLEVARSSSVCPTCLRPYSADEGHLEDLDKQIAAAKKQIAVLRPECEELKLRIKSAETSNESRRQTEHLLEKITDTLNHQKAEYEDLLATYEAEADPTMQGRLEQVEADLKRTRLALAAVQADLMSAASARGRLESANQQVANLEQEVESAPRPEIEDISGYRKEADDLRELSKVATSAWQKAEAQYASDYSAYKSLAAELGKEQERQGQRAAMEKRLATSTALAKYLRANRDRFMASAWDGIMSYASTFASDSTGGAIERVIRTEDGAFAYVEGGETMPIEAASGAQRSIMGLGVQIALSRMLPCALDILILDEPSSDMDPQHSLTVTSLLATEQQQLIMVSHRPLDGAVASNTIQLGGA